MGKARARIKINAMTAVADPSPPPVLQLLEIPRVLLRRCALAVERLDDLVNRVILTRTLSLWVVMGLSLSCGISDTQDAIFGQISAQTEPSIAMEIRPETIPMNSTDAQKVLSWFSQGQAVLAMPYEGMLLHGCLSEKLMNILRQVLHYKGSGELELRDVFRAQFNDYTQPYRAMGEELFHEAFTQDPRMFLKPFEELQKLRPQATPGHDMGPYRPHPSRFGLPQSAIQLLSQLEPGFTRVKWDPCAAFGQELNTKTASFHELVEIFRNWVQGITIEWPKRMEHYISTTTTPMFRYKELNITVPSMSLGKLINVAVQAIDRLDPKVRMKALEDMAQALQDLPVIYGQEARRIQPVSIMQMEDGTIHRIRYGFHDLDVITVNGICLRKGTQADVQAIATSLPSGGIQIAPDMCLMSPIPNIPIPIPYFHDPENRRRNDVLTAGTRNGTLPGTMGTQLHGELLSYFATLLPKPVVSTKDNGCVDFSNDGCVFIPLPFLSLPVFASQYQGTIAFGWSTVMNNLETEQDRLIDAVKLTENHVEFGIVKQCPYKKSELKQNYSLKEQNPAQSSKHLDQQFGYIGFKFSAEGGGKKSYAEKGCAIITKNIVTYMRQASQ